MVDDVAAVRESVLMCGNDGRLVGVVSLCDASGSVEVRVGVLFLNAGNVHRVGPNRIYVRLSRALARMGFVCCRFDFSGIGDSPSRSDNGAFRDYAPSEVQAVMDDMERVHGVKSFILAGICTGADVAFDAASMDERVRAVILINGAFVDGNAFAEAYHKAEKRTQRRYYLKRLLSPLAWWRMLTGQSRFWRLAVAAVKSRFKRKNASVSKTISPDAAGETVSNKWRAIAERGVKALLVYSDGSLFLDIFRHETSAEILSIYPPQNMEVVTQRGTDHTFTLLSGQRVLQETISSWLKRSYSGQGIW